MMKKEIKEIFDKQEQANKAAANAKSANEGTGNGKSKGVSIKNLTKGSVWDFQENDIIKMMKKAEKEFDFEDSYSHYVSVIKSAFIVDTFETDNKPVQMSLEKQGYKLMKVKFDEKECGLAIKKKTIRKITDLTYENIHHITTAKLLDVISNNFGGGWESIAQSIKDIIEYGFDISTTTLPTNRLKKKGGMYENKMKDGFDVLEIVKGTWTEAIFAKVKPLVAAQKMNLNDEEDLLSDDFNEFNSNDDMDISDDEEEMTEDNYGTLVDIAEEDDEVEEDDDSEIS